MGGGSEPGAQTAGTPVASLGHLRVDGAKLVSECGGTVQLKGVSSMWLNWENDGYALSLPQLEFMRDEWNVSVIRAAMGVEVGGGYANGGKANMLQQVETMIENAVQVGVYIIVDFHTHHAEDYQDEAIEFFSDIAARYGHLPNVLFEPYNEPLDVSWQGVLRPYHEAVVSAIRSNDLDEHENVVILGTFNWDQDIGDVVGSMLEVANVMYAVHFYSCDHQGAFLSRAEAAHAQGVPIFVTEWGATAADGGLNGTPVCSTPADAWMRWAAQNSISWTAWKLDDCAYELDQNGVEDTSCFFKAKTPVNGPWTPDVLNGHAPYVISKLKE